MLNFHDTIIAIQVAFSKSSLKSAFLPPEDGQFNGFDRK